MHLLRKSCCFPNLLPRSKNMQVNNTLNTYIMDNMHITSQLLNITRNLNNSLIWIPLKTYCSSNP